MNTPQAEKKLAVVSGSSTITTRVTNAKQNITKTPTGAKNISTPVKGVTPRPSFNSIKGNTPTTSLNLSAVK